MLIYDKKTILDWKLAKVVQIRPNLIKFDSRLWSDSNLGAKFDVEFKFRSRHFWTNSELF